MVIYNNTVIVIIQLIFLDYLTYFVFNISHFSLIFELYIHQLNFFVSKNIVAQVLNLEYIFFLILLKLLLLLLFIIKIAYNRQLFFLIRVKHAALYFKSPCIAFKLFFALNVLFTFFFRFQTMFVFAFKITSFIIIIIFNLLLPQIIFYAQSLFFD